MSAWTFAVPFLWIFAVIAVSVLYRRSKGKPTFPRLPANVAFGETWCSGRSLRNILSKIGGARNCLLIMVQDGRFVVTPQFPFNLMFLPEIYGLDVDVPIGDIASIMPQTKLFRKVLLVEFAREALAPIELVVRDEAGFISAIGKRSVGTNNREITPPRSSRAPKKFLFVRLFLALWGTIALVVSIGGFREDLRYRRDGIATSAAYVNPDLNRDHQMKMGVLTYNVSGVTYRINSIYGTGLYREGDRETVRYLRSDPQDAREDGYFQFDAIWLVAGIVTLSLSILGGLIARRIW